MSSRPPTDILKFADSVIKAAKEIERGQRCPECGCSWPDHPTPECCETDGPTNIDRARKALNQLVSPAHMLEADRASLMDLLDELETLRGIWGESVAGMRAELAAARKVVGVAEQALEFWTRNQTGSIFAQRFRSALTAYRKATGGDDA